MIVLSLVPLTPRTADPPTEHPRQFQISDLEPGQGPIVVPGPRGFDLVVQKVAPEPAVNDRGDHGLTWPVDVLIRAMSDLRLGTIDRDIPEATGRALNIPEQPAAVKGDPLPRDGVVVVIVEKDDWLRAPDTSDYANGHIRPIPALFTFDDEEPQRVDAWRAGRGSYITADSRGLIIDADLDLDPVPSDDGDLSGGDEVNEVWAWMFLPDFAVAHAERTQDYQRAHAYVAALTDPEPLRPAPPDQRSTRQEALNGLRAVQLRIAARATRAVQTVRQWQTDYGYAAFRLQTRLAAETSRLDIKTSEAFARLQPIIESAEQQAREAAERRRDVRVRELANIAGAVVGGVALVGLFAALAAIPDTGSTFNPYLRAAFAAVAIGGVIAAYSWALLAVVAREPKSSSAATAARWAGRSLMAVGVAAAVISLTAEEGSDLASLGWLASNPGWVLLGVLFIVLSGVLLLAYGETPRDGAHRSHE